MYAFAALESAGIGDRPPGRAPGDGFSELWTVFCVFCSNGFAVVPGNRVRGCREPGVLVEGLWTVTFGPTIGGDMAISLA